MKLNIPIKLYNFTAGKIPIIMHKYTFLLLISFFTIGIAVNGQSFLQLKYGASLPTGQFGESANMEGNGHAQTGLGLQAEYYNMVFNRVGLGVHYSFSFNSADFLRTGYRYAENYTNIVSGKYGMHDITGLVIINAFSVRAMSTSVRISGGTSFVSYPEVTKHFYENEQLTSEEVLMSKTNGQKYLCGLGASLRYAVSNNTGISLTIDYQNRFGGDRLKENRNYNIEQVFVVLGVDFILGKK